MASAGRLEWPCGHGLHFSYAGYLITVFCKLQGHVLLSPQRSVFRPTGPHIPIVFDIRVPTVLKTIKAGTEFAHTADACLKQIDK